MAMVHDFSAYSQVLAIAALLLLRSIAVQIRVGFYLPSE
jgi:hypothetical protein